MVANLMYVKSESFKRGNGMEIDVTYFLKSEYNLFAIVEN